MVHPAGFGRCQVSVVVPDYLYHYPCFKKVQLAAVKKQTFHPNLPTFRAMLRDSVSMCWFMLWKLEDTVNVRLIDVVISQY